MDDKDQNLRDEMNDIVAYLESDEEMRRKIRCAIKNKMKIKIVDVFLEDYSEWKTLGRELHKAPVSLERQGLLRLLPETDEIPCSQETWPLV